MYTVVLIEKTLLSMLYYHPVRTIFFYLFYPVVSDIIPAMKENPRFVQIILLAVFFLSGVSALVYQVIWIRMLGQVFGLTIFAVSTVLTAFMAGLALGSYLFGKAVDKSRQPLFLFMLLEAGIGLFALLFPFLLRMFSGVYVSLFMAVRPDLYGNSLIRFVIAFLLLLFPTTLMGGTLPVISKHYVRNLGQLGGKIGNLYSVNNLGAVAGCFLSSFVFIQAVGLSGSIYIAAAVNMLIAAAVFIISKIGPAYSVPGQEKPEQHTGSGEGENSASAGDHGPEYSPFMIRLVLWVFAIEGFTTLSYEVIWTRVLLGISYDRSAYFYAVVIIAFIFGLSAGSFIVSRFIDRKKNLVFLLGVIETVIGITSCLLLVFFVNLSEHLVSIRPSYAEPWIFSLGKEYVFFFLLLIVPAILMGMTFPIVAKIYTRATSRIGAKLGIIGCLDTIGSIAGSFAAGFILIPFIGVVRSMILTAGINVALGLLLVVLNPRMKVRLKVVSAVVVIAASVCVFFMIPHENYFRHWQTEEETDRLLFYKEGLGSTIAVAEKFDGTKELAIDGAVTAIAEYGDIRVHKLLGYLPYLVCRTPRTALVVGFGMGITTQSLIREDMEKVTCVEISGEIIEGSADYFRDENRDVLKEKKLEVIIEDGRSYIAATKTKFDIITTNAVHPRLSINIYTKEFYELCKQHLTDQGVMCQWMATNWLSEYEYKMLLRSFIDVFPHTTLWISNIGHVLLLGTPEPLKIDFRAFVEKTGLPGINADLKEVHLDDPFAFLALYACGMERLVPYLSDVRPNTDDYPLPDFSRYISTFPNPGVIDEIRTYDRDVASILLDPDKTDVEKLKRYIDAEKYFLNARSAYFGNNTDEIAPWLEKAISLNSYNFMFHQTLGSHYLEAGDTEKAGREFSELIMLDKKSPLGYIDMANSLLLKKNYGDAVSCLETALALDPDNGLARYLLSILYRLTLRFDDGARELEFVTRHYPRFNSALYELGEVYYVLGRFGESKKQIIAYLEKEKNDKEALGMLNELKKMGY